MNRLFDRRSATKTKTNRRKALVERRNVKSSSPLASLSSPLPLPRASKQEPSEPERGCRERPPAPERARGPEQVAQSSRHDVPEPERDALRERADGEACASYVGRHRRRQRGFHVRLRHGHVHADGEVAQEHLPRRLGGDQHQVRDDHHREPAEEHELAPGAAAHRIRDHAQRVRQQRLHQVGRDHQHRQVRRRQTNRVGVQRHERLAEARHLQHGEHQQRAPKLRR
mmetsp:Transcript_4234/g.16856  ORF Transcript_4234/g.16856 Transcript_4234/m.16856 type:complete len:227 (+) Transcript_4234:1029-1709(+)